MTHSIPIERPWYRQLLVAAAAIGVAVGVLGLGYLGITGKASEAIFGDPRTEAFSGEWWWIAVTATGGALVALLRPRWKIPEEVPGGVAVIESGTVDHRVAPSWIAIAAISAVAGASLGPSFALVMMGGGLGSWVASRRWWHDDDNAMLDVNRAGIAGGFGGAFT